jgi:hypothetical protein
LILRCHHPCFFFYNDSFQSAVDTASYLFLFAACLRVPLYPVLLVLDSILYSYIIIFGKLLLGYRSSISSKPTDLADHFYDTQTIPFFYDPYLLSKEKKKKKKKRGKQDVLCLSVIALTHRKVRFLFNPRSIYFILFYFAGQNWGISDILSFILERHWRCQAPTRNKTEIGHIHTNTHIHTYTHIYLYIHTHTRTRERETKCSGSLSGHIDPARLY